VSTPDGVVLSVPDEFVARVESAGDTIEQIGEALPSILGLDGWRFFQGVFRWSEAPTEFDAPGTWVSPDHPDIPDWLRPFNADVLVASENDEIAAGVGRKVHDEWGQEIAVVTEEGHRGRGWAKRLVSQAAAKVIEEGAVPTYLHAPNNEASARTADACGFPDRGWRVLGLFPTGPG
jgi:GNAT superfamily N-acetyltransferase